MAILHSGSMMSKISTEPIMKMQAVSGPFIYHTVQLKLVAETGSPSNYCWANNNVLCVYACLVVLLVSSCGVLLCVSVL